MLEMEGKILKYFSYRGFGFIEAEDSEKDLFFHMSNYPANMLPFVGQLVEFKVVETARGKEAVEINVKEQKG